MMCTLRLGFGVATFLSLMAGAASAQERMPSFSTVTLAASGNEVWVPDRLAPDSFANIGTFEGRSNVLRIGILRSPEDEAARPFPKAGGPGVGSGEFPTLTTHSFNRAQHGRAYTNPQSGAWTLSADLWIESTWSSTANNGLRRAELWGLSSNNGSGTGVFPALGFTNEGGTGRFRWSPGSWQEGFFNVPAATAPVNYGAWNSFKIEFVPGETLFRYYVNDIQVASTSSSVADETCCGAVAPNFHAGVSNGFNSVRLMTYNYTANSVGYSVNWSNSTATNPDTDGDGVCDGSIAVNNAFGVCAAGPDAAPNDPCLPSRNNAACDALDSDNDGLTNGVERANNASDPLDVDTDNDGTCDGPVAFADVCVAGPDTTPRDPCLPSRNNAACDALDSDNDGLTNGVERANNASDPLNVDTDNDGTCDGPVAFADVCVAGPDTTPRDPCLPSRNNNACDVLDTDGDGIINGNELVDATDPLKADTDNDGICDGSIAVNNAFGVCAAGADAAPNDPCLPARNNAACDALDSDNDGLSNGVERTNNASDPLDVDTDNDGTCDGNVAFADVCAGGPDRQPRDPCLPSRNNAACDALDSDNDGLTNDVERANNASDPLDVDTDNDGTCDGAVAFADACAAGPDTAPRNPCVPSNVAAACGDRDGDGVSNDNEDDNGTDPDLADTDGDGLCDGDDDVLNVCDDGETDPLDACAPDLAAGTCDEDGDGFDNEDEDTAGTDPEDPDTDGDGVCDGPKAVALICIAGPDAAPLNPCLPIQDVLACDDGDEDNDGLTNGEERTLLTNPRDADSDRDGLDDGFEVGGDDDARDTDGDDVIDALDDDDDDDGVPTADELDDAGEPLDANDDEVVDYRDPCMPFEDNEACAAVGEGEGEGEGEGAGAGEGEGEGEREIVVSGGGVLSTCGQGNAGAVMPLALMLLWRRRRP